MPRLPSMLTAVIRKAPAADTIRKMIILRDRRSYEQCAQALKLEGIIPVKQLDAAHMLCCHLDQSSSLRHLLQHPFIRRIETDSQVRTHRRTHTGAMTELRKDSPAVKRIPWGVQAIHAPNVWSKAKGQGIKFAIIDTGISPHQDLRIAGGVNTIHRFAPYTDDNGHGTHVAGIAAAAGRLGMPYGVAPKVSLYAVKALDRNGDGYVSDIVDGVEWCIANGMDIINMSLGLNGHSEALRATIRKAHSRGIIVVASAGNSGSLTGEIDDPARFPETIAVAATDRFKRIPEFSSRGIGIDVCAPGDKIISTNHKQSFSIDSGTSMAAPHVSGTIALLLSLRPNLSPEHVRNVLRSTAEHLEHTNSIAQGSGLIDARRIIAALTEGAAGEVAQLPVKQKMGSVIDLTGRTANAARAKHKTAVSKGFKSPLQSVRSKSKRGSRRSKT